MLTQRVIVGLIMGAVAIFLIVRGGPLFFALVLILGILALAEYFRLVRPHRPFALAGFAAVAIMLTTAWYRTPASVMGTLALALLLIFAMAAPGGPKPGVTGRMAFTILGVVWIGFGFASLLLMRHLNEGAALVLTVVFGTWAGDTVAYFTGRMFGSTPMAPRLSPKKTWEGFAGGTLGTIIVAVIISVYTDIDATDALAIGALIALVGPIGDLFESLLKRDAEVKDAGRVFPGHGGVLDRFDALLFASVASYYLATLALGF